MTLKITILGCGNSAGVPAIGNHWGNCDPDEPKNRRSRPSIGVQSSTTTLVIDTGPDLREQINRENIQQVDAVLYTHAHGDHVCGIDDLRVLRLRTKKLIDIYGNKATIDELQLRFDYLFRERAAIYPEVLVPHIFTASNLNKSHTIGDVSFIPFEQDHGTCKSLGYRFGDLAYSTDVVNLDQRALDTLQGIKTWIVDGSGYKLEKNLVHLTLNQLYALNEIVKAERVILTHLTPAMDYRKLLIELPEGYEPAYDGMTLTAQA
jgi:phosphoribosyl 1,2-cyclic phosphate phosphodiesterase